MCGLPGLLFFTVRSTRGMSNKRGYCNAFAEHTHTHAHEEETKWLNYSHYSGLPHPFFMRFIFWRQVITVLQAHLHLSTSVCEFAVTAEKARKHLQVHKNRWKKQEAACLLKLLAVITWLDRNVKSSIKFYCSINMRSSRSVPSEVWMTAAHERISPFTLKFRLILQDVNSGYFINWMKLP